MPKSKILNQVQDLVRHDRNVILELVSESQIGIWHSFDIWILRFEIYNYFYLKLGSRISLNPSPNKLNPSTSVKMATPGKAAT